MESRHLGGALGQRASRPLPRPGRAALLRGRSLRRRLRLGLLGRRLLRLGHRSRTPFAERINLARTNSYDLQLRIRLIQRISKQITILPLPGSLSGVVVRELIDGSFHEHAVRELESAQRPAPPQIVSKQVSNLF